MPGSEQPLHGTVHVRACDLRGVYADEQPRQRRPGVGHRVRDPLVERPAALPPHLEARREPVPVRVRLRPARRARRPGGAGRGAPVGHRRRDPRRVDSRVAEPVQGRLSDVPDRAHRSGARRCQCTGRARRGLASPSTGVAVATRLAPCALRSGQAPRVPARARRSASVFAAASETTTACSHAAATWSPHQAPSAHRSVPNSPV